MTAIPEKIATKAEWANGARINAQDYANQYHDSIADPERYWAGQAETFVWQAKWQRVQNVSFDAKDLHIKWFEGATLNITENCIDRHLPLHAEKTAVIWERDELGQAEHISFQQLHDETCRMANMLKAYGVKKGDRVTLYMPMVPEAAYAMLACARIGAIHSVVFGGFSPESLRGRIEDCKSDIVITADEGLRGGKKVPLKANVDKAIEGIKDLRHVFVLNHTGAEIDWCEGRDVWMREAMAAQPANCTPEAMDAEDPLFILYTSGSTGKPKGLMHTTAGYMVYVGCTFRDVFDVRSDDVYWCTADVGWVTGHSYMVYGPLLNATTTLLFEGVPTYPDASRLWQTVDAHQVTQLYTAPTAVRALMAQGDGYLDTTKRRSLRILGSVGEPINPEAWWWLYRKVGEERCPIVDTWWQTETGGHLITPLPGATPLKPGIASKPYFGVVPKLIDAQGEEVEGEGEGLLCIAQSWPGQARSIYGDHQRFIDTYFSTKPGMYFSGDGAKRDAEGYIRVTGRVDDVLNVSGHRLGTAEIEAVLNAHPHVSESAVIGVDHAIKGQAIVAYVTLNNGVSPEDSLKKELNLRVRSEIGAIASLEAVHFAPGLPKTRSGKIMRRILRKLAEGETSDMALGDTSTLLNPEVVEALKIVVRAA